MHQGAASAGSALPSFGERPVDRAGIGGLPAWTAADYFVYVDTVVTVSGLVLATEINLQHTTMAGLEIDSVEITIGSETLTINLTGVNATCPLCTAWPCICCTVCNNVPCTCCTVCNNVPCTCCTVCNNVPCTCCPCPSCVFNVRVNPNVFVDPPAIGVPGTAEFRCVTCLCIAILPVPNSALPGGGGGPVGGGGGGGGGGGVTPPPPVEEIPDEDPPLAGGYDYVDELHALSLFRGIGVDANGNPIFALDQPLTRLQALILTIRLLGLEEEALAYEGNNPFTDVTYDRQVPYVAFGFSMGITRGISDTLFGPNRLVTNQEFTTFLLRSLGYSEDDDDFTFETALDKALEIELFTEAVLEQLEEGTFLRGDAVVAMVNALLTLIKDSEDTLLLHTLVDAGVIFAGDAYAFIVAIERIDAAVAAGN